VKLKSTYIIGISLVLGKTKVRVFSGCEFKGQKRKRRRDEDF